MTSVSLINDRVCPNQAALSAGRLMSKHLGISCSGCFSEKMLRPLSHCPVTMCFQMSTRTKLPTSSTFFPSYIHFKGFQQKCQEVYVASTHKSRIEFFPYVFGYYPCKKINFVLLFFSDTTNRNTQAVAVGLRTSIRAQF